MELINLLAKEAPLDLDLLPDDQFRKLTAALERERRNRRKNFDGQNTEKEDKFQAALERFQTCFGTPLLFTFLSLTPEEWRTHEQKGCIFSQTAEAYSKVLPYNLPTAKHFYKWLRAVGITMFLREPLGNNVLIVGREKEFFPYLKTLSWGFLPRVPVPPVSIVSTNFIEKHARPDLLNRQVLVRQELKRLLGKTHSSLNKNMVVMTLVQALLICACFLLGYIVFSPVKRPE